MLAQCSPVGLSPLWGWGHYRMWVCDRKGAEARSGLEVTVSHTFFLFNCSMVAAPPTSSSIIDQARWVAGAQRRILTAAYLISYQRRTIVRSVWVGLSKSVADLSATVLLRVANESGSHSGAIVPMRMKPSWVSGAQRRILSLSANCIIVLIDWYKSLCITPNSFPAPRGWVIWWSNSCSLFGSFAFVIADCHHHAFAFFAVNLYDLTWHPIAAKSIRWFCVSNGFTVFNASSDSSLKYFRSVIFYHSLPISSNTSLKQWVCMTYCSLLQNTCALH